MNEQTLRTFHPNVRPFIREVMINGRIGIGAGNLRIADVQTGRPTIETSENGDRFKLSIPFAGQLISWEIVFNSYRPSFPPDFCFHDESFLSDPEVNILEENVPSLAKWDAEDPKSLLHVISELLALYRKHQMGCLSKSQGQIKKQMELLKAELTEGQICMTTQDIEPVDKKIEDQGNNYGKVKKQIGLLKGIAKKEQKYHSHENEPIQDKKIIENLNNNLWSAKKCKVIKDDSECEIFERKSKTERELRPQRSTLASLHKQKESLKANVVKRKRSQDTQRDCGKPIVKKVAKCQGNNSGRIKKRVGLLKYCTKREQNCFSHEKEPVQGKEIIDDQSSSWWSAKKCKVLKDESQSEACERESKIEGELRPWRITRTSSNKHKESLKAIVVKRKQVQNTKRDCYKHKKRRKIQKAATRRKFKESVGQTRKN